MAAEVITGRFLGQNLLAHTIVQASNFAIKPWIAMANGEHSYEVYGSMVQGAIVANTDAQELGLLMRVMVEKVFRDVQAAQIGGESALAAMVANDERATFLCIIANATPTAIDPLGGIPYHKAPVPFNEFEVTRETLFRILRMRNLIGFDGIKTALREKQIEEPKQLRAFIRSSVVNEITAFVAEQWGIEDNSKPLHTLVENITALADNAYELQNGWRPAMAGPYKQEMDAKHRVFDERMRAIANAVDELSKLPLRYNSALGFKPRDKKRYELG